MHANDVDLLAGRERGAGADGSIAHPRVARPSGRKRGLVVDEIAVGSDGGRVPVGPVVERRERRLRQDGDVGAVLLVVAQSSGDEALWMVRALGQAGDVRKPLI